VGTPLAGRLGGVDPSPDAMPFARIPEPFDHPIDGFRALARIDGHRCRLVSRRGNLFKV